MSPEEKLKMDLILAEDKGDFLPHERETPVKYDPRVPVWLDTRSGEYLQKTNPNIEENRLRDKETNLKYMDTLKKYDELKLKKFTDPKFNKAKEELLKDYENALIESGVFKVG